MITYKIHLIRTGSTSDGMWQRYVGQSDLPLSQKGAEALEALARECEYPRVDIVFTSPLTRCAQTADILYPETWTETMDSLMDMNLGEFEGKTVEELRGDPDYESWMQNSLENSPPDGESTGDFTRRIVLALHDIFTRMMEQRMTNAAVITHAGVIMTLLTAVGLPKQALHQWTVNNGCGYTLLMTPQLWMRDRAGEVYSHIPYAPLVEDNDHHDGDDGEAWGGWDD